MSDKSNKYGYVGVDIPAQADRSNSGIFSVENINELISVGNWTLDSNRFDLLYDYEITSGTANNIQLNFDTTNYKVHKVITRTKADASVSGVTYHAFRYIENGTTITSGSYNFCHQLARSGTDLKLDYVNYTYAAYSEGGSNYTNQELTFYNLGNSSMYSTWENQSVGGKLFYGAGIFDRATVVNGIEFYAIPESAPTSTYGVGTQILIYGCRI